MSVELTETSLHVLNMWTRMPFRYGPAALTALPHVFLRATVRVNGGTQTGLASEGLAPKWFVKDPELSVAGELGQMFAVLRAGCEHGRAAGEAGTFFDWWLRLYEAQRAWGRAQGYPALQANLGAALVERAVIDALCRANGISFAEAVRTDALGLRLGKIHAPLTGAAPADFLPTEARRSVAVRHTVGLGDPLTEAEIEPGGRLEDGLPQSLAANIERYGLRYFKIKAPADADAAVERFRRIEEVIRARCHRFALTVDGNEFFRDADALADYWRRLRRDERVRRFFDEGLLFLEQPLHRDVALSDEATEALSRWTDRPPVIIDESDDELAALPRALQCGYAGTSHKNCKGVVKGIANACLIEHYRRTGSPDRYAFSGEDLTNVGPVALLQDLAVGATLGLDHVERNGHHYFAGLSAMPVRIQRDTVEAHGDLYDQHTGPAGAFPSLRIEGGGVQLGSVVDAPFGCAIDPAPEQFTPLEEWEYASLGLGPPAGQR